MTILARNMMGKSLSQDERTLKIKDPSAKGNVMYDVPYSKIRPTQGSREHCGVGGDRKPSHRACFCKLYLENRCGQGAKCKSLHVEPEFVANCRKERNVTLDDQFINEVVVRTEGGIVFAVRFPAVIRTRGLDAYKKACQVKDQITPFPLCAAHNPGLGMTGQCARDRYCDKIHVKHAELKDLNEYRLRTPCCSKHGDESFASSGAVIKCVSAHKTYNLSDVSVAASSFRPRGIVTINDVCHPHIKSRCKYGRACGKIHVCRKFAEQSGLLADLEQEQGLPVTPPRSPKQDSLYSAMSTPRQDLLLEAEVETHTGVTMPRLVEEGDDDLIYDDLDLPHWDQDAPYSIEF